MIGVFAGKKGTKSSDEISPELLSVQVLSAKGTLWEGEASAVSSVNSQGPFDLLPQHAHFICLVENKPIVVVTGKGEQTFTFGTAVIRLLDNIVTIYVDIN